MNRIYCPIADNVHFMIFGVWSCFCCVCVCVCVCVYETPHMCACVFRSHTHTQSQTQKDTRGDILQGFPHLLKLLCVVQ